MKSFHRAARMRSESFDEKANTIEIVWSTGAPVRRYDFARGVDYDEHLSMEPGAVRLDRLNLGAPFLDSHNSWGLDAVIGSVLPGSARIEDGVGKATIILSKADGLRDTVQKLREGVIRNISVGYAIHDFKRSAGEGDIERWDVVDWEPLEISAVPIPADAGAQIRSIGRGGGGPSRADRIRRYASVAGMQALGEKHVRLGTNAKSFRRLLVDKLRAMMGLSSAQREADKGAAEARRLIGFGGSVDRKIAVEMAKGAAEARRALGGGSALSSEPATDAKLKRDFEHGAAEARALLGKK